MLGALMLADKAVLLSMKSMEISVEFVEDFTTFWENRVGVFAKISLQWIRFKGNVHWSIKNLENKTNTINNLVVWCSMSCADDFYFHSGRVIFV